MMLLWQKTDWQWQRAAIRGGPWRQDVGYFMRTKFRLDLLHSTSLVLWWHHKLDLRKELDKECVHPSTWMMFPTNGRTPRIGCNQWQRANFITWSIILVATPYEVCPRWPGRKHKQRIRDYLVEQTNHNYSIILVIARLTTDGQSTNFNFEIRQ